MCECVHEISEGRYVSSVRDVGQQAMALCSTGEVLWSATEAQLACRSCHRHRKADRSASRRFQVVQGRSATGSPSTLLAPRPLCMSSACSSRTHHGDSGRTQVRLSAFHLRPQGLSSIRKHRRACRACISWLKHLDDILCVHGSIRHLDIL